MRDVEKALAEIAAIRGQVARSTQFHGLGAATLAATGLLALTLAAGQAAWLPAPSENVDAWLTLWCGLAVLCAALIGSEMVMRTSRARLGLAQEMIATAVGRFTPAAAACVLVTAALHQKAPETMWMLPGLWQVIFSLGLFASRDSLPPGIFIAGLWYLTTGVGCLALGGGTTAFAPWLMGLPFGAGQILIAAMVWRNDGGFDGQGQS
jgi:hypothetical protein